MQHTINVCKRCKGESIYIHLPPLQGQPAEHKIVCKSCDYETETHKYSLAAIREWNQKQRKG